VFVRFTTDDEGEKGSIVVLATCIGQHLVGKGIAANKQTPGRRSVNLRDACVMSGLGYGGDNMHGSGSPRLP
jgi:hypothetical protein